MENLITPGIMVGHLIAVAVGAYFYAKGRYWRGYRTGYAARVWQENLGNPPARVEETVYGSMPCTCGNTLDSHDLWQAAGLGEGAVFAASGKCLTIDCACPAFEAAWAARPAASCTSPAHSARPFSGSSSR